MNVFYLLSIFFVPGTVLDSKFRLYMVFVPYSHETDLYANFMGVETDIKR